MNRTAFTAIIFSLFLTIPTLAEADFYVSGHAGIGQAGDTTIPDAGGGRHTVSHDLGSDVGLAGGYALPFFRVEAELNYRNGDAHRVDGINAREGDFTAYSAMANVYFDIDNPSPVTPFLGAGAGVLRLSMDDLRTDTTTFADESDSSEAWQLMVGTAVKLAPHTNLDITYRYLDTTSLSWGSTDIDYTVNSVVLGLRYTF